MDHKFFGGIKDGFDFDGEKENFIKNMDYLKGLPIYDVTLYKKWAEIKNNYEHLISNSGVIKAHIWRPRDIQDKKLTQEDFEALDPVIVFVDPSDEKTYFGCDMTMMDIWLTLRVFVHSMDFIQNPGRFLRFIVMDRKTETFLGASSMGSDVMAIGCRDKKIGWTKEQKVGLSRLNNTAIATTIMSTQPFGYNFLGGKLVASLMVTQVVEDAWNALYPDSKLVGVTTTSLYGTHSMYQRIPYWKEMGETIGKIFIKPEDSVYDSWHHYIQKKYPEEYKASTTSKLNDGPATGIKQKILTLIMKELQMKQSSYSHGFKRGVFFAPLFENTYEFLRGEISEAELIPLKRLQDDRKGVIAWWKEKGWRRYENLFEQGRLNSEILFYNKLHKMTWEDVKSTYLEDVGR